MALSPFPTREQSEMVTPSPAPFSSGRVVDVKREALRGGRGRLILQSISSLTNMKWRPLLGLKERALLAGIDIFISFLSPSSILPSFSHRFSAKTAVFFLI